MKFLSKNPNSPILKEGMTYKKEAGKNNRCLKEKILQEQNNFCAYTEKYIQNLDATELEHFNPALKYNDDYYNYYSVIRQANQYKKDDKYKGATFFDTLFFQNKIELENRITYLKGGVYEETNLEDSEARDLIDFLGFNDHRLFEERRRSIKRLISIFDDAGYDP